MKPRAAVPEAVAERMRLLLARLLEAKTRQSSQVRGAALVFHTVGPRQGDPLRELDPPVRRDRLDAAVAYLVPRYTLVRAAELLAAARARRPGDPVPVALTFDDDLPSHYEHAAPILQNRGAVATVFLCGAAGPFWWHLLQTAVDTSSIGPNDLPNVDPVLLRQALDKRPRAITAIGKAVELLDPHQRQELSSVLAQVVDLPDAVIGSSAVAALSASGWEIGFHTRRHDVLSTLRDDELREALEDGRDRLLGGPPLTLAYPHGKATEREAAAASAAGYVAAFTGRPEILTENTNPHLIGRLQPNTSTVGRFALQIARALAAG